jgi:hypothetical protein
VSRAEAGGFYVRQLLRAVAAGRLVTERIVVVDRDPACAARGQSDPRLEFAVADWSEWLDGNLGALGARDHLVPYHWAPHLLVDWLRRQAERQALEAERGAAPLPVFELPFERATRDGDRALSYATWPCPPACIEPALCPHTRGPRDWSLAARLDVPPRGFDDAVVFRSLHLVHGVGTIPVAAILAARARVLESERLGERRLLVATASHCHGLATALTVRPRGRASQGRTLDDQDVGRPSLQDAAPAKVRRA